MEQAYSLTAIPCGACVREHSGGHPPKSRPSRHPGRAGSGHGRPRRRADAGPARAVPTQPRRDARPDFRQSDGRPVSAPRGRR
jgi:hypothetical protein